MSRKNMPMTPTTSHRRRAWRPWLLAPLGLAISGALVSVAVVGADAPPVIRAADISSQPLYAASVGD